MLALKENPHFHYFTRITLRMIALDTVGGPFNPPV